MSIPELKYEVQNVNPLKGQWIKQADNIME